MRINTTARQDIASMHVHSTTHLVIYAPDYDTQLTPDARE
jgi:hypothetical protein